ncbi:GNAT family N-acetyltransferase [Radiobacillus deserti]|uniref:GNAT family N-acetyltransferase n=1 Tax=Radiobacillus deserti TaxID=2594883 RepID=A0A516KI88_9BACI|nr:GNAT family N-acetyltransferase [Radiobacillus deserti]QDP41115.1 GNAT family N-acetyltransferase [Radiobacillus deserti]
MLYFREIDVVKDRSTIIEFRKDSFKVSFGDPSPFGEEEDYVQWVKEKMIDYPDGFVLLELDHIPIGQVELSIRSYEDREIGYVHLYYICEQYRGKGYGKLLHDYAINFFKRNHIKEFHLRVSPTNKRAIQFYRKIGLDEIGPELDGKVIRMRGIVS